MRVEARTIKSLASKIADLAVYSWVFWSWGSWFRGVGRGSFRGPGGGVAFEALLRLSLVPEAPKRGSGPRCRGSDESVKVKAEAVGIGVDWSSRSPSRSSLSNRSGGSAGGELGYASIVDFGRERVRTRKQRLYNNTTGLYSE